MKKKIECTKSSGNIFEDIGLPDAQERLAKVDIAIQINAIIKKKKLTQTQAADLLDIDQPKISLLSKGRLSGFSLERLFRFLTILGQDIIIKISPKKVIREQAQVSVVLPRVKKEIPVTRHVTTNTVAIQAQKKQSSKTVVKRKTKAKV